MNFANTDTHVTFLNHHAALKCSEMHWVTLGFSFIHSNEHTHTPSPSHHDVISSSLSDTLLMGDCKGKTQAEKRTHPSGTWTVCCHSLTFLRGFSLTHWMNFKYFFVVAVISYEHVNKTVSSASLFVKLFCAAVFPHLPQQLVHTSEAAWPKTESRDLSNWFGTLCGVLSGPRSPCNRIPQSCRWMANPGGFIY